MIPIYNVQITDAETGIDRISLVEYPAVESNFLAFSDNKKTVMFSANEEQQMIVGCLMRADFPIYRKDEYGEYYIQFSKDVIKQMAEKLLKDGHQNWVNIEHINNTDVNDVNMVELFIKNTKNGINPKGFEQIEDGSLFAVFKVRNPKIWDYIKNDIFKGFSIEGVFNFAETDNEDKTLDEIITMLDTIIENRKYN